MVYEQGDKPGDDPNKYGLKFDSEKPRWELLPKLELMKIVDIFKYFTPSGKSKDYNFDLTKFNRESLINDIFNKIMIYDCGIKTTTLGCSLLSMVAFEIFFLLKGESYTKEELERSEYPTRWDLLNVKDIEGVVNVYTMGARKYADGNWKKVSKNRYYDALVRHFITIRTSDYYDSELGCLHMHQAIWNVIALMWMEERDSIPGPIRCSAKKLKGISSIKIKPILMPDKVVTKKRVAKKKKKKKSTPVRNPKSGKD